MKKANILPENQKKNQEINMEEPCYLIDCKDS